MGYKGAGYIIIKPNIYAELEQYKQEGESWNSFMLKVLQLIKQDSGEDEQTQQ